MIGIHAHQRDIIAAAEERGWTVIAQDVRIEGERINVILEDEAHPGGLRIMLAGIFVTADFVRSLPTPSGGSSRLTPAERHAVDVVLRYAEREADPNVIAARAADRLDRA